MPELEPVLDWENIQGNILGGFNKNHQTLIGVMFGGDAAKARSVVAALTARVTPLSDVVPFVRQHRARVAGTIAADTPLAATWLAVAFSFAGLKLLSAEAEQFRSAEFRNGLPASSSRLGDPPGSSAQWVIGKPGTIPDLFVIVAADQEADRAAGVQWAEEQIANAGLVVSYQETGHDLSFYSTEVTNFPAGHEHFGFKDGVSQPGIRGKLPDGSFLTDRTIAAGVDGIEYAAAGQPLVCAGEFVLGYSTQIDDFPRVAGPVLPLGNVANSVAPAWAQDGSFLVFRRLRQDVGAFRAFAADIAAAHPTVKVEHAEALLIGRWPSGAAVMRSPNGDDQAQADPAVISAFGYGDDNPALGLPTDSVGSICPIAAHIRKVNPRDDSTDQGAASATLQHRILRRGLPYGSPFDSAAADDADRGLLFLSYQSSINRQFEFLASQWMNNPLLPRNPSDIDEGMGFDMLIGQRADNPVRFAYIPTPQGPQRIDTSSSKVDRWVTATGGGYFFAPSIAALKALTA